MRSRAVGDNGEEIAAFMFELMTDPTARNADRIEAAKWLGDRGFGRPIQGVDLSVNQVTLEALFRGMATEDLDAMIAIYENTALSSSVESGESRSRPAPFDLSLPLREETAPGVGHGAESPTAACRSCR